MYKKRYSLGGYIFEIDSLYEYFVNYAKEYITDKDANYSIVDTNEELDNWIKEHHDTSPRDYLETLLIQTKVAEILIKYDIYIFHGSSVYLDDIDNGYIFTGTSGVGKSTHVKLLKEVYKDRLVIINDDKPFIDTSYNIYGSPWSGKSHISNNLISKLKGIFILYQSRDNKVRKLDSNEAINYLIKQIYIPKGIEASSNGLEFLIKLVKEVPIYSLGLNLDKDAYKVSSKIMLEGK